MAKKKRSEIAARGTKADANREVSELDRVLAAAGGGAGASSGEGALAPGMNSKREQLTRRIFTTVEIVLVAIPFVLLAMMGVLNIGAASVGAMQDMMRENPSYMVTFLAACVQPFAAYLLRVSYRHYERGEGGYVAGNLIVMLCAEMFMRNLIGIVGMAVLLWRVWKRAGADLGDWARERGVGGVAADISGALVVLVLALVCAFASFRLM